MTGARAGALALALTFTMAVVPMASAAPSAAQREARHHFDEGEALYRAGHYAEALAAYQAGYAAQPLPGFLVNIAQCQRRLGDLKTAQATYREFVLVAPDSRLVPEVEELIKQLDDLIADLAAGGAGGAADEIGGEHDVHATDPTAPALSLAAASPEPETPILASPTTPAPVEQPPRRSHARWWLWGGIAVAAVAGGVATAFALSSSSPTTVRSGTLGTLSR